jgi:hypothetical protein
MAAVAVIWLCCRHTCHKKSSEYKVQRKRQRLLSSASSLSWRTIVSLSCRENPVVLKILPRIVEFVENGNREKLPTLMFFRRFLDSDGEFSSISPLVEGRLRQGDKSDENESAKYSFLLFSKTQI